MLREYKANHIKIKFEFILNLFIKLWSVHNKHLCIMKKILFLLVIGGALITASCTKQYNSVEPNQTVFANIASSNWGTANAGITDTVVINTPQIDGYFNKYGNVSVALTFDGGTTYEPIPYVYNNISYSYIYGVGGIELYAQSANGTQVITTPPASTAKIIFSPSN